MPNVYGEFRVDGLPRNGATVNLYFTSAGFSPNNPPQAGDPFPTDTPVLTTLTGPSAGSIGAFRFLNVPSAEYYVGVDWNGLFAWQYFNATNYGANASGSLTINAQSSIVGNILSVQLGGLPAFNVYTSGGAITNPAATNLNEYVSGGATQYRLVNPQGVAPVSGILNGVLILNVPDNCTAIQFMKTADLSGRLEIRLNDQWAFFANGPKADFARGWCGFHDYHMPNPHGSALGSDSFWQDSDHQVHIAVFDDVGTGGGELLYLEHHTNIFPVPNNETTSIRFGMPGIDGVTVFEGGLVQCQSSAIATNAESTSMNIYRRQQGSLFKALAIRENGEMALLPSPTGTAYMTVLNDPEITHDRALLAIGGAGFLGHGVGTNFNGGANGTGLAMNWTGSSLADFCNFQIAGSASPIFRMDPIGNTYLQYQGLVPNTIIYPFHLRNLPTFGTPAAGLGSGIEFGLYNDTAVTTVAGQMSAVWASAATGNEQSFFDFKTTSGTVLSTAIRFLHTKDTQHFGSSYSNNTPDTNVGRGLVNIGDGTFASRDGAAGSAGANGFSGTNQGTYLAINSTLTATSNLCDLQRGGNSQLALTASGALLIAGPVQGNVSPYQLKHLVTTIPTDANWTVPSSGFVAPILEVKSFVSLGAQRNVVIPANDGAFYMVFNNTTGGQSIQVIAASGTGIVIATGKRALVQFDGTNVVRWTPDT